jgi:hypothetical protein
VAIYKKGQKFAGPYSAEVDPDFQPAGDNLKSLPSTGGGSRSMDVRSGDGFKLGQNLASNLDVQYGYGFAFDDDKNANWSKEKSRAECGGFAGPAGRSNNHPRKGNV